MPPDRFRDIENKTGLRGALIILSNPLFAMNEKGRDMIEVFPSRERWIIAKNVREVGGDGIHGSRSRSLRTQMSFERCWTGTSWSPNGVFAMSFDSEGDANKYMEAHRQQMETAS